MDALPPLRLAYRPPPGLHLAIIVMHLLSGLAVIAAQPGPTVLAVAALALPLHAIHTRRRLLLPGAAAVRLLLVRDATSLTLVTADGSRHTGQVTAASTVLPWLVVLCMRLERGGRRTLVVTAAAVGEPGFRRLRVRLLL